MLLNRDHDVDEPQHTVDDRIASGNLGTLQSKYSADAIASVDVDLKSHENTVSDAWAITAGAPATTIWAGIGPALDEEKHVTVDRYRIKNGASAVTVGGRTISAAADGQHIVVDGHAVKSGTRELIIGGRVVWLRSTDSPW